MLADFHFQIRADPTNFPNNAESSHSGDNVCTISRYQSLCTSHLKVYRDSNQSNRFISFYDDSLPNRSQILSKNLLGSTSRRQGLSIAFKGPPFAGNRIFASHPSKSRNSLRDGVQSIVHVFKILSLLTTSQIQTESSLTLSSTETNPHEAPPSPRSSHLVANLTMDSTMYEQT